MSTRTPPMPPPSRARTPDEPPFRLPPGPYSPARPDLPYAALIGQAILASPAHALTLQQIYAFITTVYPHFSRAEQTWQASVRHVLSTTAVFRKARPERGRTRWAILPRDVACFAGGGFRKELCADMQAERAGRKRAGADADGAGRAKRLRAPPPAPDEDEDADGMRASTSRTRSVSTSSAGSLSPRAPQPPQPPPLSPPPQPRTPFRGAAPVPQTQYRLSALRTPLSHLGVHMGPSPSLAHYKYHLNPPPTAVFPSCVPARAQSFGDVENLPSLALSALDTDFARSRNTAFASVNWRPLQAPR